MTDSAHTTLMRRMTRTQDADVAENPLTTSRAVRLALTKAANDTVGLSMTVRSVAEEQAQLDAMLGDLPDGLMLTSLLREGAPIGLAALDMQLRAAVVEMETVGALIDAPAEDRAPTGTDQIMVAPMMRAFLQALPEAIAPTPLAGWADGITPGAGFADTRAAGLILTDCAYRILRLEVELGVAERAGLILLALPLAVATEELPLPVPEAPPWAQAFPSAVARAPARLDALLHRFSVSLATAEALRVGTLLPLPGATVENLRLLADDGRVVGTAKLGQMGGMRAVRLQVPPAPEMIALGTSAAPAPPPDMQDLPDLPEIAGLPEPDMALAVASADGTDEAEFLAEPALDGAIGTADLADLPDLPEISDLPDPGL